MTMGRLNDTLDLTKSLYHTSSTAVQVVCICKCGLHGVYAVEIRNVDTG